MSSDARRFPIRFDGFYRVISTLSFMPPGDAYVALDGQDVSVRMAWGFRARFPRAAVAGVQRFAGRPLSRGVHGWGGRWLVNGSAEGLLEIRLEPEQAARVIGFPVRLHTLLVSVADPEGLSAALGGAKLTTS